MYAVTPVFCTAPIAPPLASSVSDGYARQRFLHIYKWIPVFIFMNICITVTVMHASGVYIFINISHGFFLCIYVSQ